MKRNLKFLPTFFILIILSITILALSRFGIISKLEGLTGEVLSPLREALVSFNKDTSSLQQKISDLTVEITDSKDLTSEINALRDQFKITNPRSLDLLPAKIVGMPNFIPGATLPKSIIINVGNKDGVRAGQAGVVGANLVGIVTQTNSDFSKIELITSSQTSFTAKTESNTPSVIKGQDLKVIRLDNIVVSEDIKKGALIFTKGDQDINGVGLPPDLVVGKVVGIEKKPTDIFQTISVESLIDFTGLERVFIVM